MALQYTTLDKLQKKLNARLQIDGQPSGLGRISVSGPDVQELAEDKEALIDAKLARVYALPLKLTSGMTQRLMSSMVEASTIADLLPIHQVDPGASSPTSYRSILFAQYKRQLGEILSGDLILPDEDRLNQNDLTEAPVSFVGSRAPEIDIEVTF